MLSTETHRTSYYQWKNWMQLSDFINDLPFRKGSAMKYIYRAGNKQWADEVNDLKKAMEYIQMRLNDIQPSPNE